MLKNLKEFSLPKIEEKVLEFWKSDRIFEKSLAKTKRGKKFVFYEGPPTANGRPGIHHVLARVFKDIVLRYKTMAGFYAPRRGGWDTHGLPVEIEVEKSLGLKSKAEIEKFGIAEFNKKCRESVWKYKNEWERFTERIGFWLDLKNPYITYENSYIETLWWIIQQIAKRKLLYKGHKVVPWCSRCGTSLSSHEMALGYNEVEDTSVYVKFKIKNRPNTYILSWTTTLWTLPGNVALAVGEKIKYLEQEIKGERLIYAKYSPIARELGQIGKELSGKSLVGLEYEPLFKIKPLQNGKSHKIYAADFVTTTEGTGVVHTAVMYGEDDYNLGKKVGLPQHHTVDEKGKFTKDVAGFEGMYVKAKETEEKIVKYLERNGNLLKTEKYLHEYPFCWRCNTPLIYYARDSWFVVMSKLRSKLQKANGKINWIPAHIKTGRFGEWLREAKDWNFSRERYWGTPLPVWQCEKCAEAKVIGGFDELEKLAGKSTNCYILVRHGQAQSNLDHKVTGWPEKTKAHLTLFGRVEVEKLAKKLAKTKVHYIYSSDLTRTKETEQILADIFKGEKVYFDERLREINTGKFNGCHDSAYHAYFTSILEKFTKVPPGGESLSDLRKRLFGLISELEKKHQNKTIVIVSHEYPIWMLWQMMTGASNDEAALEHERRGEDFIGTGEAEEIKMRNLPRDETGLFDVHRPYVDEVKFGCVKPRCNGKMKRVKEVVDAWFDSGAMPFASSAPIPADYISEAVDQTRGWFYTLLAVAVLMNKGNPYRNVICLGHVLDKYGRKMSKSKGNVVDPWQMIEKYGTDAVRWYLYTITPPGEPKKFDEADLGKALRQTISLIYNSFVFFETYASKNTRYQIPNTKNVLDRWVIARLAEAVKAATAGMDKYDVGGAAHAIEEFVSDLSRWYIRRSRRRLQKPDGQKDYNAASETLGFVLLELSKLLAPFTPFFAEALYKSLVINHGSSVHLENWPKIVGKTDKKLLGEMKNARLIASSALAKRAELGIKVRQPLNELKIKNQELKSKEITEILKDEVNVKKIAFDRKLKEDIWLDAEITHELKEEGWLRELVRMIQGLRQDAGLTPKTQIILVVESPGELNHVVQANENLIKKEVNAKSVEYGRSHKFESELETKIDDWPVWIALRKPL